MRPAQGSDETLVDVGWALQRLGEGYCGLWGQLDALTLGEDLFGPERGGLQHERRDVQTRRGSRTLE